MYMHGMYTMKAGISGVSNFALHKMKASVREGLYLWMLKYVYSSSRAWSST